MLPLIRLTADWAIPTYLTIISFTYCLCTYLVYLRASNRKMPVGVALDVCLCIMIGGFLGARIFHIAYEEPGYYLAHPVDTLKFWQGGFVYFGGLIGALVTTLIFLHQKKEPFMKWGDFFAPVLSLGYALGRIACFFNGCCYGAICSLPWAVTFHGFGMPVGPRHPTQLYATLWELAVFAALLTLEKKKTRNLFVLWLVLHSVGRIIMEYFRDDDRGPLPLGLSIATWISIVFIVFGVLFFVRDRYFKKALS